MAHLVKCFGPEYINLRENDSKKMCNLELCLMKRVEVGRAGQRSHANKVSLSYELFDTSLLIFRTFSYLSLSPGTIWQSFREFYLFPLNQWLLRECDCVDSVFPETLAVKPITHLNNQGKTLWRKLLHDRELGSWSQITEKQLYWQFWVAERHQENIYGSFWIRDSVCLSTVEKSTRNFLSTLCVRSLPTWLGL